tara:strand:+ start:962 stop:1150 length:189 start_codon:yes stop_codon:yes gene_type:complete
MKSKKLADLRVAVSLENSDDKEVIEEAVALIYQLADEISELETQLRAIQIPKRKKRKRFLIF